MRKCKPTGFESWSRIWKAERVVQGLTSYFWNQKTKLRSGVPSSFDVRSFRKNPVKCDHRVDGIRASGSVDYFKNPRFWSCGDFRNVLRISHNNRCCDFIIFRHCHWFQKLRRFYMGPQTDPASTQTLVWSGQHKIAGRQRAVCQKWADIFRANDKNQTRGIVKHIKSGVTQGGFIFFNRRCRVLFPIKIALEKRQRPFGALPLEYQNCQPSWWWLGAHLPSGLWKAQKFWEHHLHNSRKPLSSWPDNRKPMWWHSQSHLWALPG